MKAHLCHRAKYTHMRVYLRGMYVYTYMSRKYGTSGVSIYRESTGGTSTGGTSTRGTSTRGASTRGRVILTLSDLTANNSLSKQITYIWRPNMQRKKQHEEAVQSLYSTTIAHMVWPGQDGDSRVDLRVAARTSPCALDGRL